MGFWGLNKYIKWGFGVLVNGNVFFHRARIDDAVRRGRACMFLLLKNCLIRELVVGKIKNIFSSRKFWWLPRDYSSGFFLGFSSFSGGRVPPRLWVFWAKCPLRVKAPQ